jgi:cbb3-type cytochrome oxidase subunit 3
MAIPEVGAADQSFAIAVLVINFLTLVAGYFISIYRENRRRRWDIEDRARLALELKVKTAEQAEALSNQMKTQHETIEQMISDNTEVSVKAFQEANGVNEKLAQIGVAHLELTKKREGDEERRGPGSGKTSTRSRG